MYNQNQIEEKWQKIWESNQLFQNTDKLQSDKDKLYLLFAFAYPSGSGLHVGHVESKTALDILARYYRMNNKNVFFPVGWDAFGLPAENYAIKTGVHPSETTKNAINTFRSQIKRIGISYDFGNEISTAHKEYYKWTQWIFTQLYKKGLAYQGVGMVNWCPSCQTVLANEQVVDGKCERCDSQVVQKDMKQWFYKITQYQDELIEGLKNVDWPEPTKSQQINWIGRKSGANVTFKIDSKATNNNTAEITCFTTRLDTVFGVTFVVISPEKFKQFSLIDLVSSDKKDAVSAYIDEAFKKTEEDRQIGEKNKTGVDTGLLAINPVSGEKVLLYVADYVLGGFGTGAVMGVPAHDKRDEEFAVAHGLPIKAVIETNDPQDSEAYGVLKNSGKYDGLSSEVAVDAIANDFAKSVVKTTNYRLRDWLISRQRYWGAPIPVVYDPEGRPHLVKEEHLPWELPTDVDFKPTGESPLKSSKEFLERTEKLYGKGWTPEYDTMDTFVDSSWYFLRYTDSRNANEFANKEKLNAWLPVDLYMIGPEHIVLHLLYSRFFTKFLRDEGYFNFDEPFMKMRHQGMILGPDGKKMSKSKGNVINPDDVIEKFGADTLRVYEMFMGPLEADKPWDVRAVIGVYKFLQRVKKLVEKVDLPDFDGKAKKSITRKLHQTIKKVTDDLPRLKFNTAIAALMEFLNLWQELSIKFRQNLSKDDKIIFVKLLCTMAPFMSDELYANLTNKSSDETKYDGIHLAEWPKYSEELAKEDSVTLPVQINGKLRANLQVPAEQLENQDFIFELANKTPELERYIKDQNIVKKIYVKGKVLNFVIAS